MEKYKLSAFYSGLKSKGKEIAMFKHYEDGREQTFSFRKVYRLFQVTVDTNQKAQGTTFTSWLAEMEHMQILVRS